MQNLIVKGRVKNKLLVWTYALDVLKELKLHRLRTRPIIIKFKNDIGGALGLCEGDKQYAYLYIAKKPNTEFLDVEKDRFGQVVVDSHGATNVPGVFAAGDCTHSPYNDSRTRPCSPVPPWRAPSRGRMDLEGETRQWYPVRQATMGEGGIPSRGGDIQ
jgi:hypothetical protein